MSSDLGRIGDRHYLDHASTSPLRPEAIAAMEQWQWAADPSRVHTEGRMARAALEHSRAQVAEWIQVRPRQIVLTSGGTEAINAAVEGVIGSRPGRVVFSGVEHSAVTAASSRHRHTVVRVDSLGRIDLESLESELAAGDVALVHCQWANHEVGTRQPLEAVVEVSHAAGALVHVDASAALGHDAVQLGGADLLSFSGHKFGAPAGTGGLVLASGLRINALLRGGSQERGRRAGMENVAAAAGLGAVAEALASSREGEAERAREQIGELARVCLEVEGVTRYGDPVECLPHVLCLGVTGVEAEGVLIGLDQAGVAAHSGSSCSSEDLEPSPVLEAMGVDADHSLRFSVGWNTTEADITAAGDAFLGAVERLRALGG